MKYTAPIPVVVWRHLANNLRRYRADRRMTQADLAARAGFKQQYVSNLERGMYPTDRKHIGHLARALDVPVSALSRPVRR